MIKFFWYLFSFLTILLITTNNPSSSNKNFISQNKIFNFRSDQLLLQKLIAFCSFVFFVFTIICLSYSL